MNKKKRKKEDQKHLIPNIDKINKNIHFNDGQKVSKNIPIEQYKYRYQTHIANKKLRYK